MLSRRDVPPNKGRQQTVGAMVRGSAPPAADAPVFG
jgi:hypothetical protein